MIKISKCKITFRFLIFFILKVAEGVILDEELCKLCGNGAEKEHIYCMFPDLDPKPKAGCEEIDISATDQAFRVKMLEWHNEQREKLAVGSLTGKGGHGFRKAANMRLLHYDIELETLALRNAQNCYGKTETCRLTSRFEYSQNLGNIEKSKKEELPSDVSLILNNWMKEAKNFDVNSLKFGSTSHKGTVEHFTSVVWAQTRLVGCAQVFYKNQKNWRLDAVCNYGPTGNKDGQHVYEEGEPCSRCPKGTQCGFASAHPNLCGGIDIHDKDILPVEGAFAFVKKGNFFFAISLTIFTKI